MDGSCSEKSSDEEHAVVALCDHPLARTTWHLQGHQRSCAAARAGVVTCLVCPTRRGGGVPCEALCARHKSF